ncbi:MAG: transglutaminase domain-containing protein [Xenococcaceae cyanobacterium]
MNNKNGNRFDWIKAYRPFFFEDIADIVDIHDAQDTRVMLIDKKWGLLTEVELISEIETFKKKYNVEDYAHVESICYYDGSLYSVSANRIYCSDYQSKKEELTGKLLVEIPNCSNLTGITVTKKKIYLVTENKSILAYDRATEEVETLGKSKGIGFDDLCYHEGKLFLVDSQEQTVYVFDLKRREFIYEILTPFENPTGITSVYHQKLDRKVLYVAYSRPSFEVYDTGDSEFQLQIDTPIQDNFIYPLLFQHDDRKKAVLSNGFVVEMCYVEKLHATSEIAEKYGTVKDLEWKISLPITTDRQEVTLSQPLGNFDMRIETIAEEENRRVAVFSIPEIDLKTERRVFGWKALVKVFGIRYCVDPEDIREISEAELNQYAPYLKNERKLDMESRYVIEAAQEAVQDLSDRDRRNILKKTKAIRDYIYERLTYVMDRYHDGTEQILRQGEGSCGEYLNVFLSLLRLNQIPARKCGNYKIPAYKMQAGSQNVFLSPDFNHVWLQFYVPDLGWVPLESSADDDAYSFREWAQRYFMSLAWYHMECRIGSYFEDVFEQNTGKPYFLAPGDLAIKDIKFKLLQAIDFG